MSQEGHAVVLVLATSHAVRLEKVLVSEGIPCKMIPVPRHLSSDCGVCIRIRAADAEAARTAAERATIEVQGVFPLEGGQP